MLLVDAVFFPSEGFSFHCFLTSSLTLPWTITGFLHQFYTFSPAHRRVIRDTFILIFLRFSCFFTVSATGFWEAFFTSGVFYLALLIDILTQFCGGDEGRNTPIQILLYACPHRVVFHGWHAALNHWCYSSRTSGITSYQCASPTTIKPRNSPYLYSFKNQFKAVLFKNSWYFCTFFLKTYV